MLKFIRSFLFEEEGGDGGGSGGGGEGGGVAAPPAGGGDTGSIFSGEAQDDGGTPAGGEGGGDPVPGSADPKIINSKNNGDDIVSTPFFKGLYDETGKINKDSFDNLPDHLKKHAEKFKRYDTVESLFSGMSNLISLSGKKGDLTAYERPGEDAPQQMKDDHAKFMKAANNVPDKPEGYGIEKPDTVPQGVWDAMPINDYLKTAHKHNVSPEALSELFELNMKHNMEGVQSAEAEARSYQTAEVESFKKEHGSRAKEVRALAERVQNRFNLDGAAMSSAANVSALARIGAAIGEDNMPSGGGNPDKGLTDRQKALSIVNNENDPMYKAYHDPNHHQHKEAVALKSAFNKSWLASQK